MSSWAYCPVVTKSNLVLYGNVSHLQHLICELCYSLVVIFELQRIIGKLCLYWTVRFTNDNISLLQTNELISFNDFEMVTFSAVCKIFVVALLMVSLTNCVLSSGAGVQSDDVFDFSSFTSRTVQLCAADAGKL